MNEGNSPNLDRLFYPKSLAVVGATPRVGGFNWGGNGYIDGSVALGFQGRIYPVHPSGEPILGLPTYKNIREIPGDVDLVVLSVSYKHALSVMRDCVAKGVKFVHVFAAGFSETGLPEQRALEDELVRIARKGGIRIVGPNCMGLYCPQGALAWNRELPKEAGLVSFVSQSGQLAGDFVDVLSHEGLRFDKVVSFGNACDLQSHDFYRYFLHDDRTRVVASYLEGIKNGEEFFRAARELTPVKPLIVWKGGTTEGGSRATQSHTAAIAGSIQVWEAVCRQTGIIPVRSMEELAYTVAAVLRQPLPRSANVAILGGAGGGSVTMTDAAERAGLKVPHLSEATVRGLSEFVPLQGNSVQNPLDIMGALFFPARQTGKRYRETMENFKRLFHLLKADPNIDSLIFAQGVEMFARIGGRPLVDLFVRTTIEALQELKKPVFILLERGRTLEGDSARRGAQEQYNRAGFATFSTLSLTANVIRNLYQYRHYLDSLGKEGYEVCLPPRAAKAAKS